MDAIFDLGGLADKRRLEQAIVESMAYGANNRINVRQWGCPTGRFDSRAHTVINIVTTRYGFRIRPSRTFCKYSQRA